MQCLARRCTFTENEIPPDRRMGEWRGAMRAKCGDGNEDGVFPSETFANERSGVAESVRLVKEVCVNLAGEITDLETETRAAKRRKR